MSQLHVLEFFCLILPISYFPLHHSLSELSSAPKFYLDCGKPYLVLFAIVYDSDDINYVVTVLRSKLHTVE